MQTFTLKQARSRPGHKHTQATLATTAGVNQSIVSRAENGSKPSLENRQKLASALGLKVEQLRFAVVLLLLGASLSACGSDSPASPSTPRRAVRPVPLVTPAGDGR